MRNLKAKQIQEAETSQDVPILVKRKGRATSNMGDELQVALAQSARSPKQDAKEGR